MIEYSVSANQIIGSLIYRTREALRKDQKFIDGVKASPFGVNYFPNGQFNIIHIPGTVFEIKNNLFELDKSPELREHKYPAVFNYEQKTRSTSSGITTITINLSFVALTGKEYLTEERERYVFDPILRPIFREFIRQIRNAEFLYRTLEPDIPTWIEIFTTGAYSETAMVEYPDWIDAIEIRNYGLRFKDCNNPRYQKIIDENNLLIQF